MKAALNGVLNCSILDGWWDECFAPELGWAIGERNSYSDLGQQDHIEATALYDLLKSEVIPCFYDRAEDSVPVRWLEKVKASVAGLGPFVTADRMLRDYIGALYEPAARQGRIMEEDGFARDARACIVEMEGQGNLGRSGRRRRRRRCHSWRRRRRAVGRRYGSTRVGWLPPTSRCSSRTASSGPHGELETTHLIEMQPQSYDNGVCSYQGSFVTASPGLYGFTVRVLPAHPDLIDRQDLGLVEWSQG